MYVHVHTCSYDLERRTQTYAYLERFIVHQGDGNTHAPYHRTMVIIDEILSMCVGCSHLYIIVP